MTILGQRIVEAARTFCGCPFHHQGRVKEGMDCIGLLVCIAKKLELPYCDVNTYNRYPVKGVLDCGLAKSVKEIPIEDARDGDILTFWISRVTKHAQHVAIKSDKGMIHTYSAVGKVVESTLDSRWTHRLCAAYRFIEV